LKSGCTEFRPCLWALAGTASSHFWQTWLQQNLWPDLANFSTAAVHGWILESKIPGLKSCAATQNAKLKHQQKCTLFHSHITVVEVVCIVLARSALCSFSQQ